MARSASDVGSGLVLLVKKRQISVNAEALIQSNQIMMIVASCFRAVFL